MKQSQFVTFTLLLALALSVTASATKPGLAPTASPQGNRREVSLNLPVLTVQNRLSGETVGKCSFLPMVVSVSDDRSPLRISFSDDTPHGSGATIRNSAWMAALVAALQNESPLQGVRISLDFKGGVDGPSAGAVMCLGILSGVHLVVPQDGSTGFRTPDHQLHSPCQDGGKQKLETLSLQFSQPW